MSAAKRRIKRKIAQLVRMDDTRSRMRELPCADGYRAEALWNACMKPLAKKLDKMGLRSRAQTAVDERAAWRVDTGGWA